MTLAAVSVGAPGNDSDLSIKSLFSFRTQKNRAVRTEIQSIYPDSSVGKTVASYRLVLTGPSCFWPPLMSKVNQLRQHRLPLDKQELSLMDCGEWDTCGGPHLS